MKAILVGQRHDLKKQDKLTFDNEPKEGSQNPVTSDGIYKKTSWNTNPNLLDNWYFLNPVNQRGQNSYATNGYGIDRWIGTGTVTLSNGVQVSGNIAQRLDLLNAAKGKEFTLSALDSSGNLQSVTGTFPLEYSGAAAIVNSGALQLGYDSNLGFIFAILLEDTWIAAKLELGSVQTLAHKDRSKWILNEIPDYGEQLARCQRYQELIGYEGRAQTLGSAYLLDITIPYKVQKAKRPTFTFANIDRTSASASYYAEGKWNDIKATATVPDAGRGMAETGSVRVFTEAANANTVFAFYLFVDANL